MTTRGLRNGGTVCGDHRLLGGLRITLQRRFAACRNDVDDNDEDERNAIMFST